MCTHKCSLILLRATAFTGLCAAQVRIQTLALSSAAFSIATPEYLTEAVPAGDSVTHFINHSAKYDKTSRQVDKETIGLSRVQICFHLCVTRSSIGCWLVGLSSCVFDRSSWWSYLNSKTVRRWRSRETTTSAIQ